MTKKEHKELLIDILNHVKNSKRNWDNLEIFERRAILALALDEGYTSSYIYGYYPASNKLTDLATKNWEQLRDYHLLLIAMLK